MANIRKAAKFAAEFEALVNELGAERALEIVCSYGK